MGYTPASSDAPQPIADAEPLKILWIGDLKPHTKPEEGWHTASQLVSVDKYNLPDLLEAWRPEIQLEVQGHLDGLPKLWTLKLHFDHFNAFNPSAFIPQVPALTAWLALRDGLQAVKGQTLTLSQLKTQLSGLGMADDVLTSLFSSLEAEQAPVVATPAVSPSTADPSLDNLLRLVDLNPTAAAPSAMPSKPENPMDALIRALAGQAVEKAKQGPQISTSKSKLETLIEDVTRKMAKQLDAILHHPQFEALCSTWLGLKQLVAQLDFRRGVKLDVLSVSKNDLNEAFYHQVLMPSYQSPNKDAFVVGILDFTFGDEPKDLERMADLCDSGASIQLPLLASAAMRVWAEKDSSGQLRIPTMNQHLNTPAFLGWSALRSQASAAYLTLALPHVLLRNPYRGLSLSENFSYDEAVQTDGAGYLWGRASTVLGGIIAQSHTKLGKLGRFVGVGSGCVLENIPIWKSGKTSSPLMVWAEAAKQQEVTEAGFAILAARPETDAVYVGGAQTLQKVANYTDPASLAEAQLHATLPCQLITNRIAQRLIWAQTQVPIGQTAEDVAQFFRTALSALLPNLADGSEQGVKIEVAPSPNREDAYGVGLWITVPASILGEEISMALGFEVQK